MAILSVLVPDRSRHRVRRSHRRRPSVFSAQTEQLEIRMVPAQIASAFPAGVPANAVQLPPQPYYNSTDGLHIQFFQANDRIYAAFTIDMSFTSPGHTTVTPRILTLATYDHGDDRSLLTQHLVDSQTVTVHAGETKVVSARIAESGCTQYDTWQYGYVPSSFPDTNGDHYGDYNSDALLGGGVFCRPEVVRSLERGDTATIGFWHNKNGQALINSLNGGPTSTNLATWLAKTLPNLYGSKFAGKDNAYIADYFLQVFSVQGQKTEAQLLANALAVYVTDSDLAGNAAVSYGFNVSTGGTGATTYNVGSSGAAFGVPNGTSLTVLQIIKAADSMSSTGVLYNGNTTLLNLANTVFDRINQSGDIT